MRSSNCPARPTNGRPMRSSSPPGASPTSMIRASGAPSANTSCVAVAFRPQPSKRSSAARNSSSVRAAAAASRAERAASSGAAIDAGAGSRGSEPRGAAGAASGAGARRAAGAALSAKRSCGVSSSARSTPASLHQRNASAASARSGRGLQVGSWSEGPDCNFEPWSAERVRAPQAGGLDHAGRPVDDFVPCDSRN